MVGRSPYDAAPARGGALKGWQVGLTGMRIAFATSYDPHDVLAWSGTGYYAARSLQEQGAKLTFTGPMAPPYPFLGRAKRSFYRRVLARHYRADRDPLVLRYYARTVAAHLRDAKADVVLSLEGTLPIAYLECPQPLAFWGDATFAAMVDYYPGFTRLCTETRKGGHKADRLAINKSCACLYSNEWAAASALRDYGADPARVQVVPFGANIDSSLTNADLEAVLANRPTTRCNLLFLGASWERKGGDTALAVVEELNKAGLPTHLTIIGAQPRAGLVLPRYATALGFISKRTPQGMGKLDSLLAASHY